MNTSDNKYDALESLIYQERIRIEAIDFHFDMDLFLIVLNTKVILCQKISSYPKLKNASREQLCAYELIGGGTGIHWPEVDEDLSLKGFLREELKNIISGKNDALAA